VVGERRTTLHQLTVVVGWMMCPTMICWTMPSRTAQPVPPRLPPLLLRLLLLLATPPLPLPPLLPHLLPQPGAGHPLTRCSWTSDKDHPPCEPRAVQQTCYQRCQAAGEEGSKREHRTNGLPTVHHHLQHPLQW
jgi:hypothetical protein